MQRSNLIALSFALSSLTGCGTSGFGRFDNHGFRSHELPYAVAYDTPQSKALLPADWVLDNVRPGRTDAGEVEAKAGQAWESTVSIDADGDGKTDHRAKLRDSELVFRHARSDATIWLSVYPIPQRRERVDLDVLAREYVEAVSGSGRISTISLESGGAWVATKEKRLATRILSMESVSVSGLPGVKVTYEVANVDQIQLAREARWLRASLVFVRPGWWWSVGSYVWPVLLVAGHESVPERFAEGTPDFDRFLSRIELYGDTAKLDALGPKIAKCFAGGPTDVAAFELSITADGRVDGRPKPRQGVFGVTAPSASAPQFGLLESCADVQTNDVTLTPTGFPRKIISVARPVYEAPRAATIKAEAPAAPAPTPAAAPTPATPVDASSPLPALPAASAPTPK